MQGRIEAALYASPLKEVEKKFADAFLHDDLLVKLFRSSKPIWMASGILT